MPEATCSVVEDGIPCTGRLRRGMCRKHYERWLRHGDPLFTARRGQGVLLAELQAAGKATTDECLILATHGGGRPVAKLDGTLSLASRVVWILANGDPGPLHVLHTCHRGDDGCVNLRHLYLGTNEQNVRDMVNAGRARGGRQGRRKLMPEQVREIRNRYAAGGVTYASLAAEYGVSEGTVRQLVRGRAWTGLDG